MNKIKKVLVNDGGRKTPMSYQEFINKYSPNYEPYFVVCIIQGHMGPNAEVWEFPTEGLLYNVRENMYYYMISQQVIPHTHPAIIPSAEEAFNAIKREVKMYDGKTSLIWKDGNKQYKKDLGFSTSWTKEEYDNLNIEKDE